MSILTEPSKGDVHAFLVEAYTCGSHAQLQSFLVQLLATQPGITVHRIEQNAKKWHWKLRSSSVWACSAIPVLRTPSPTSRSVVFASSMLNTSELVALRPDLHPAVTPTRLILYFHENQLAYPMQRVVPAVSSPSQGSGTLTTTAASTSGWLAATHVPTSSTLEQDRDFQFGWAQLLSCLTARILAWNSGYNMESFLDGIPRLLHRIPDREGRPAAAAIVEAVRSKSVVMYFPVALPPVPPGHATAGGTSGTSTTPARAARLRIVWPHRWEYDKCPDSFFSALATLHERGVDYEVYVLGESFSEVPPAFPQAQAWLQAAGKIGHWGYLPSKEAYWACLRSCDVVVSTACHEFFGVSTVEAILAGCYPLLPNDLAYPEVLWPTPAEREALHKAQQRIRDVLRLPASASLAALLPSPSGSGPEAPQVHVRRGDLHWKPPARTTPCPHLYNTQAQLVGALADCARRVEEVRMWGEHVRRRVVEQGSGQGEAADSMHRPHEQEEGSHEATDSASGPASKRARPAPHSSPSLAWTAEAVASNVLRFTHLQGLFTTLLL